MEDQHITLSDGNGSNPAFLISLNSFDLSFLPKLSSDSGEDTVSLWTASSGPGVDYSEFQVLVGDRGSGDENFENIPSHRCYICEIDVPVCYWAEHISSVRHEACATIATTSLDRAKEQISVIAQPQPHVQPEGSYYCQTCSTIIAYTKQSSHEQSKKHSKSALYENLLQSFTKLYQNEHNLTQVCEEISDILSNTRNIKELNKKCEFNPNMHNNVGVKLNRNVKQEIDVTTKTNKEVMAIKESKDNAKIQENNGDIEPRNLKRVTDTDSKTIEKDVTNSINAVPKEKLLNVLKQEKSSKDSKLETKTNKDTKHNETSAKTNLAKVLIEAESGAELSVEFDNYHGLYTAGNNTQCRVCRILVDGKLEHVQDIEHKKMADGARIRDKNCIRQLNHSQNHCILCNEIIENPEAHIVCSVKHNTMLYKALLKDDNETDGIKEKMTTNYIQDVDFNKDFYYCQVCERYFTKPCLIDHISNRVHINCMQSLSDYKKNNLKMVYIQSGYCYICEVNINKKGKYQEKRAEKRHLLSKEHRYKVWLSRKDDLIHYHMNKTNIIDQVSCKVCNIEIHVDSIDEHLNRDDHQTKYQKLMEENYMKKINDINVFCSLCNKTELVIDEMIHIRSKCHKKLMVAVKEVKPNEGNSENKELEIKELAIEHRIQKHNVKHYHCKICYVFMTEDSILNHITSKKHRKNYKQLLDSDFDQGISQNVAYNYKQPKGDSDKQSSSLLKDIILGTTYYNQSIEFNTTNDNLSNLAVKKRKRGLMYLFEITDDPYVVQCMPCDEEMHWDEISSHVKGKSHINVYNDLLNAHTMFRVKGKCFCECCLEILRKDCEYIHINSSEHRQNLERNNERLDEVTRKDLSMKMFYEYIKNEKKEKLNFARQSESFDESEEESSDSPKKSIQKCTMDKPNSGDKFAIVSDSKDNSILATNVAMGKKTYHTENKQAITRDNLKNAVPLSYKIASTSKAGNDNTTTDSLAKPSKSFCESKCANDNTNPNKRNKTNDAQEVAPLTNEVASTSTDSSAKSSSKPIHTYICESKVAKVNTSPNNLNTKNDAPNSDDLNKNIEPKSNDSKIDAKNTGFYVCNVCQRPIENNPIDIKSHLESAHHGFKVAEQKQKEKEGVILKSEGYFCDTCHIHVTNNAFAIKKHMDSELHASNFEKLLHLNRIRMRDDTVCYCGACDLFFSKSSMPTHIQKAKHKLLLSNSNSSK